MKKRTIVVSGINLFQGGPLSIFYDFLDSVISLKIVEKYTVIAFVHSVSLFAKYNNSGIDFIELPKSRKNYLYRFYYEYIFFRKFSKQNDIFIWISLHDITPSVKAEHLFTYCHNPSPFRKVTKNDFASGIKSVLFTLFYKLVYKKNIKKNDYVIVQQEWLRKRFSQTYKIDNIVVAIPDFSIKLPSIINQHSHSNNEFIFFYPSLPRSFKNIEAICEASSIIEKSAHRPYKVFLTINGKENGYSKKLFKKYGSISSIHWLGLIPREKVFEYYEKTDCLLFPSFIETWGLPITEFKQTNKGIIVSDLPYAKETVGKYDNVSFFNPNSSSQLANLMIAAMNHTIEYDGNQEYVYSKPYVKGWKELISFILGYKNDITD